MTDSDPQAMCTMSFRLLRIRHRHVDTSQFGDWSQASKPVLSSCAGMRHSGKMRTSSGIWHVPQVRNITFRGSPLQESLHAACMHDFPFFVKVLLNLQGPLTEWLLPEAGCHEEAHSSPWACSSRGRQTRTGLLQLSETTRRTVSDGWAAQAGLVQSRSTSSG